MKILPVAIWKHRNGPVQRGFTLIELMIVVTLIALVSSITVYKMIVPYRLARREQVLRQIESLDRLARSLASNDSSGVQLSFDRRANALKVTTPRGHVFPSAVARLDSGSWEMIGFRHGLERVSLDDVISFNRHGQSASYALHLRSPGGEDIWLFFLGLSGQCLRLEGEHRVDSLFAP